jgi:pantoate--beta-alanine ligase
MRVLRSVAEFSSNLDEARSAGLKIGLVPTMGALHAGHRSLVERAHRECGFVAVTIFVNPLQFNDKGDLDAYPRTLEADLVLLSDAGADVVLVPGVTEMYPDYPAQPATTVHVGVVTDGLEGAFRPGHFDGVATVVSKLLIQAAPDAAYFGEKDYQQLMVVRRMVHDLDLPVTIVGVPTVRESNGLALSSRNVYLSAEERRLAPNLYRIMRETGGAITGGEPPAPALRRAIAALSEKGFDVEYLELRDAATLAPLTNTPVEPTRLLAAVHLGRTRLIDNIPVA